MIREFAGASTYAAFVAVLAISLCAQTGNRRDPAMGGQIFASTCAACHGLDGRGGEHAPNIATDAKIRAMSDPALLKIIQNGIPAAGMPGFSKSLDQAQIAAALSHLRSLQRLGRNGPVSGNENRGRALFFGKARCSECHMLNGQGGFLGPDLSTYGNGHAADEIREAIVNPNKDLDNRHGTVTLSTRTGGTFHGVIRNEDNFSLQMQTPDGRFHFIDKADIARIIRQEKSLMPADYGAKLSAAEINDLIRFLSR